MDIIFRSNKQYNLNSSPEELKRVIQLIADQADYGCDENIKAEFQGGDTFILKPFWAPMLINTMPASPAFLKGKISSQGDSTIIKTTSWPNYAAVFLFYIWIIILTIDILFLHEFDLKSIILIFAGISFFMGIMLLYKNVLRRSFERILKINIREKLPTT